MLHNIVNSKKQDKNTLGKLLYSPSFQEKIEVQFMPYQKDLTLRRALNVEK